MSTGGSDSHGTENLLRRITDLDAQLRAANAESMKRKQANRDLRAQVAQLTEQVTSLTTDVNRWKTQATAEPDAVAQENVRLKAEIQKRDNQSAWLKVVGKELHPKATVEKIWQEIGYQPGDTVLTEDKIKEQISLAKESAPYLFQVNGEETPQNGSEEPKGGKKESSSSTKQEPLDVEWGGSRGNSGAGGSGAHTVKVRKTDMQNPKWALNPANQKMIREANAAGNLEILDA
jgi:hypothetical protein